MIGVVCVATNNLMRVVKFYAAYFRDPDGNKLNAFLMDKVA